MAAYRYDPYLWIHLAGMATVPLWLAICGLGLAVGSPTLPGLEVVAISLFGILPVLLMQLKRPFCIFSVLLLALHPARLSEDQRRLLSLFRQWWVRGVSVLAPLPLLGVLLTLYPIAVVMSDITPFAGWGRFGGLAIAAVSFFMANLFWQVPVSVLLVMTTSEKRFQATAPYPVAAITQDFTQIGLPLPRLLPTVMPPGQIAQSPQVHSPPEADTRDESALTSFQEKAQNSIHSPVVAATTPTASAPLATEPTAFHPEPLYPAAPVAASIQGKEEAPTVPLGREPLPDSSPPAVEVALGPGVAGR